MPAPRRAGEGRLDARPTAPAALPYPPGDRTLDLGPRAQARLLVPPGDAVPRPLLVFFHGAGGSAAQSVTAVGALATARGALVLAPTSVASTWDLVVVGGLGRDVAVLDAALAQVFARHRVDGVAVGGFSDGASYALSLGLANGDLVDTVLAFSPGFVAAPGRTGRPRIWVSHGTADRVLPIDRCGRRVVSDLGGAGYDVTYEEFDGGHVVTPQLVTGALDSWLGAAG